MTLIALLLLFPTPLLHPCGPDDTGRGDHVGTRPVATVIRDQGSVSSADDPSAGSECADGEWDEDEGAKSLLDWPVLPRPCRQNVLTSHLRWSPVTVPPSVRSRLLRC